MMSVPMWHANYADDRGHIMFWTDYLSFDEMPKSIDPASGWQDRYFSAANGGIASKFRVPYDPARPLDSAYGLADPASAAAADECRAEYGALDVTWGDVFRFASGTADLPANGGPGGSGLFRTIAFARRPSSEARGGDKKYGAASGETIVCAIEFVRKATQRAECLLGYGNATQPGSPHLEDQLPLMVQKKLLPVRREKKEIEANLEMRERFGGS